MSTRNFARFLTVAWPANGDFDSPQQSYHITPGDPGGGTFGGVTEATWAECQREGLVHGPLSDQKHPWPQLQAVLQAKCWGSVCDELPDGVDIMVANGRMMTGFYPQLLQQCLGFIGTDVDGVIGPDTLDTTDQRDPLTLVNALHGRHYTYLASLPTWAEFGNGWTRRLVAVHAAALAAIG
jgi:lysozyme family protein